MIPTVTRQSRFPAVNEVAVPELDSQRNKLVREMDQLTSKNPHSNE